MNSIRPITVQELTEQRNANMRASVAQDTINYITNCDLESITGMAIAGLHEHNVETEFEERSEAERDAVRLLVEEFLISTVKHLRALKPAPTGNPLG